MNNSEILIYQNSEGNIKIDVRLEEESVWLNQSQMAELFGKGRTTITEHIQNVFSEGELEENVVCRNFRHTTQHGAIEGKTQETTTKYYNLDVIISVGYRVKSPQGTVITSYSIHYTKLYDLIEMLGGDYPELFVKQHKPKFPNTDYNKTLFDNLEKRGLIKRHETYKDGRFRAFANY